MSNNNLLPTQFAELTGFLRYALPTTKERLRARVNSSMADLQAFYDAVSPHMEAIMTYMKGFPADEKELAQPELNLMRLGKAFMCIAVAVELFHAPDEHGVLTFEDMVLTP
jgi:hypothetical protein